ncbi:MAG TPA: hypothetical protein VJM34_06145 [Novosphingobium sp.]|nr:hypothetical protein [Novosphingobium sp.]
MKQIILAAAALASISSAAIAAESTQPVQAASDEVAAPAEIAAGAMLYGSDGRRIGRVYRVDANGNPQIILNSKMVTVPASTVSEADGKLSSSLSKKDVLAR